MKTKEEKEIARNSYLAKYRQENKEIIKKKSRQYYLNNRKRISERNKEYGLKNKEKRSSRGKEYELKNKDRIKSRRLKRVYGITLEQYNEILKSQNGVCAICGNPPKKNSLSVDHDHGTGKVRGLLCFHCNKHLIGGNNPEVILSAYNYLSGHIKENEEEIIRQLKEETWCRLAPSKVCKGIGVFCIKDIPVGTDPFKNCRPINRWLTLTEEEMNELPDTVHELVADMCVREEGVWYVPDFGINQIDISFYLNHSKDSNMRPERLGEAFIAKRLIKQGEELLVSYDEYDEGEHNY